MPRKKTATKIVHHRTIDRTTENLALGDAPSAVAPRLPMGKGERTKLFFVVLLVVGMIGLFLTNKGMLLAAVVNGRPIFRWQLTKLLTSRFGLQTLEGMITERLIADAAKKEGVVVGSEEVGAKEQDIVKSLGPNIGIEELLRYQGMTKADFDNQIQLQLTVAKVLGKDVSITENDVDSYIATNRAMLAATEEGELRKEARQSILDQKIGEKIQSWLADLKQNAKILRFLQ